MQRRARRRSVHQGPDEVVQARNRFLTSGRGGRGRSRIQHRLNIGGALREPLQIRDPQDGCERKGGDRAGNLWREIGLRPQPVQEVGNAGGDDRLGPPHRGRPKQRCTRAAQPGMLRAIAIEHGGGRARDLPTLLLPTGRREVGMVQGGDAIGIPRQHEQVGARQLVQGVVLAQPGQGSARIEQVGKGEDRRDGRAGTGRDAHRHFTLGPCHLKVTRVRNPARKIQRASIKAMAGRFQTPPASTTWKSTGKKT